ncbi:hypothetical protein BDR06DRAFT_984767 [Suillus hirtellus]|nr:hypothetical protein BDR06DRAFT_984767 [Suillus hirtellus]
MQFKDQLHELELIEGIPVIKTPTIAALAMNVSNSTVAGNIQSVINLLEQGEIMEPNTFDESKIPDISEYVILFYGNLGTDEQLQAMAAADSIWQTFLQHSAVHLDETSLMQDVSVLHPKEMGLYGLKPGFYWMHQLIGYDGICRHLDCWRVEAQKRDMNCIDLEVFTASELSYEEIQTIADSLAWDYVANHKI